MFVSIIIPVYNEARAVSEVVSRLSALSDPRWNYELVFVDDGSTDETASVLTRVARQHVVLRHRKNCGKGAALRTGFSACRGDVIVTFDADMEYDPMDLPSLIEPVVSNAAPVVYGTRMVGNNPVGYHAYYFGNWLIGSLTNLLYGSQLTDVETGIKVFRREVLRAVPLERNDFGFEVEVTAQLLRRGVTIIEKPIRYRPRTFSQGKKIGWRDGAIALLLLFKYRFSPLT